jgi:hypothetical protein
MADNAQFYADLDGILDRLRAFEGLVKDAAPEVADALQAKVRENVANQVDPDGHPWPAPKDGSGRVLVNAAAAVTTKATGTTITQSVTGPEALHHTGEARGYRGGSARLGGYRRPLIPWKNLPGPFKAVVRRVLMWRAEQIGVRV